MCTGRLLHIGHSFIFNLPLEGRKCVLGLDRRVSNPDICVGPAPTPTRSSLTHCAPPSRRSSPSVPGHSAPTRVVVYPPTQLLRAAEPQEFALGPRPPRPDQGRRSSPYPPTAGRRAAGVRPRSPATAPRPGSSFNPQLTYCRPPSRRSSPSVPGHSIPTRVVFQPPTHLLQAAEPQEFALGPRPQRLDQGRLSTPNSPTAGL